MTEPTPTFVQILEAHAANISDKRAFAFMKDSNSDFVEELSYGALREQARRVAAALRAEGVKNEMPVVLLFPPGLEFIGALFGCFYAGAIAVPATDPYRLNRTQTRLTSICRDAGVSIGLTTASVLPQLAAQTELNSIKWLAVDALDHTHASDVEPLRLTAGSIAVIQYTSGSTSQPKGVALTHRNLIHNQQFIKEAVGQTERSTFAGWLPPYHDMGLIGLILHPVYLGAQSLLMSTMSFLRHPFRWLELMSRYRATATAAPNFAFDLCVERTTESQRQTLDLSCLEGVVNGAEPVRQETLDRFSNAFASCGFKREAFYPSYGLGEATLLVSGRRQAGDSGECWIDVHELQEGRATEADPHENGSRAVVSCGRPANGLEVLIVDPRTRKTCADGNVGEIWVSGDGVGVGYWNNPQQSTRTFRARLRSDSKRKFLRTGDLAFMREGELFVTGRWSDLIIVRGRNIHPEDVERTAETSHPGVLAHAGAAFSIDTGGGERICLVQEVRSGSPYAEIATALRQQIANEHEVELYSVVLVRPNQIPRTSSGKIRRKACREALAAGALRERFRSDLDRHAELAPVSQILSDLLHVSAADLGPDQNIVSLGLDSLKAVQLQQSLEEQYGVNFQMSDLFGASIQEIVERLSGQIEKRPAASPSATAIESDSFALTPGQSALWFEYERNPESSALHLGGAIRIHGGLNEQALASAFDRLLDRHSVLRSRFEVTQSIPWQRVMPRPTNTLEVHVVSTLTDAELHERLSREFNRPFDLKTDLPVRLQLYRLDDCDAVILFAVHHIVADLISFRILAQELSEFYRAAVTGVTARPVEPSFPYAEYVKWYEQLLASPEGETLAAFWETELVREVPLPELPRMHAGADRALRPAGLRQRVFRDTLFHEIEDLARQEKLTRFVILLGAFKILLHRYTQQTDIVVGTPVSVRPHRGFRNSAGYFVNIVALRSELNSADPCREYLRRLQGTTVRALDHSAYPFFRVVQDRRSLGRTDAVSEMPLVFNYYEAGSSDSPDLATLTLHRSESPISVGECEIQALRLDRLHSQFDLSLSVAEFGDALSAAIEYNAGVYEQDFVDRLLSHFEMILTELVRAPAQRISQLAVITDEERVAFDRWNETAVRYDEIHVLHKLIEQQVDRQPGAIAVSCEDRALAYAELDRKSTDLACYLVACGAGPERPVAVLLPPGLELVIGLLAILKAAAAYMPIDPTDAPERIARILKQAAPTLVLSTRDAFNAIETTVAIVYLDELTLPPSVAKSLPETQPHDLAYIMHTSGSTGEPKGVMISHQAICNRLLWMRDQYRPAKTDRILQKTPYTFDVSVWELFLPLITGVEMVIVRPGGYRDPSYLVDLIRRRQITILHFVPSMLHLFLDERRADECGSLRLVICSGEPLSPALRDRFFASSRAELHNLYGPTEAAVDVTYWPCERNDLSHVIPIGCPIANTQLFILDPDLNRVPPGITGELFIAGVGLARGYWRRPDLTARVFREITVNGDGPVRVYATGDRARYRPDGSIEFLGRVDEQVKIHGVRIELGEVEAALRRHPAIGNCVVNAFSSNGDGLRLAAYLVRTPSLPSAAELHRFLSRNLAPAFIPSVVCVVDRLPTTSSGKVKRSALPAPSACETLPRAECELPEMPAETLLAGIWREVLGLEQVGVNENFFELGGDSLRLLQVRNQALQLGLAFSVEDVFQHPTIRELAPLLKTVTDPNGSTIAPFSLVRPEVRARLEADFEDVFPLTKTQEALLFHSQSETGYEIYLLSLTVASAFREDLFNEALATIVSRHPMFRVSYNYWDFSEFLQAVHRNVTARVRVFDLMSHEEAEQEEIIDEWIRDESRRSFDWGTPPLIRFHVHRRSAGSFQLTVSHAFFDGWSLSSAIVELLREYLARLTDTVSPLAPAPAAFFRDFVAAEQMAINDPAQREFWQTKLAAAPTYLRPRSIRRNLNTTGIVRRNVVIAPQVSAGLRQLAKSAHAPLKSVLLALHLRVLSQLTGGREVATGLITHGRLEQPDGDRVVGLFLNTVPLQIRFGNESWRELVRLTFQAEQQMWPFRRYPLAEMRSLLGTTPFDTAFNYVNFHVYNQLRGQDDLRITAWKNPSDLTYFPLCAYFTEDPVGSRLLFYLDHDRSLFESSEIERIIEYYEKAFELAATEPDAVAADHDLRSVAEQSAQHEWSQPRKHEQPAQTAIQLFEAWAARTPLATAVAAGASVLSYAELNASANRLAHRLRELGVTNNVPVGLKLDRTPELMIAILAILKAGGAFVSLNPTLPEERLSDIKSDCGLNVIVGDLPVTGPELGSYSSDNLDYEVGFADLAYIMYTSGSTGKAKGVEITHGNLTNVLLSVGDQIAISAGDKWLAVTSISFDISVLELLLPLISGAQIELAGAATARDGIALKELLANSGATIMQATPSLWRLILEAGWEGSAQLRILCGGEALTRRLAGELLGCCQVLWNVYGPTETTIWSTIARVTAGDDEPSIGGALANTTLYVLDETGAPVPVGIPGELYIGGVGVARGYRNRSQETARQFLPDPVAVEAGVRMYRTGDMVVRRTDGSLDFLGRLDGQVKIRGHRVEVGEIESTLRLHPDVREAVVTVRRRTEDDVQLIAYVLPSIGQTPRPASLKEYVARTLPAYMVPAEVIAVDQFQLNANGKIDRNALLQQDIRSDSLAGVNGEPVGPTENAVARIWRELLGQKEIDRHQNLFHLGAHSLLVMRCCVKIKQELNIICGPTEMFRYPTVASIAAYLDSDEINTADLAPVETRDPSLTTALQAMIARRRNVWTASSTASD